MYIIKLQYFDNTGHFLREESVLSPGKESRALTEYIEQYTKRDFCGFRPTYVHAVPDSGEPVLIKLGGFI